MNEMYSEVREHLRRQHAMNTQEIRGKSIDNSRINRYYGNDDISEDAKQNKSSGFFSLKTKLFLFLCCFSLFACYLYGGQDVKKGATMMMNDIHAQITRLEGEQPAVKQAMDYLKNAYHEVKNITNTQTDRDEQ